MQESEIANNAVVITKRIDDESRCGDGQIGTVRHDRFERLLNRETESGNSISLNGPVFNGPQLHAQPMKHSEVSRATSLSKRPNLHTNGSIKHRMATARVAP